MKNLIIAFSLVLSFSNAFALTIVSDLDETIKITDSGSAWGAVRSAFKKGKTFTGIPEFFKGTEAYVDRVYVLSASPTILGPKIRKLLHVNGIKNNGLILKQWLKFEKRIKYKIRSIKEIMEESNDDFLLMGDDVGDDPEVFDAIKKLFPSRVLGAYIHVIKNRKIPEGLTTHFTAHDLALREFLAGRMAAADVRAVIEKLKAETQLTMIIPGFAYCPTTAVHWAWQLSTEFAEDVLGLNDTIVDHCVK